MGGGTGVRRDAAPARPYGVGVNETARWQGWREASEAALYGPGGFFVRERPARHFRTSVHASPLFAGAVAELLRRLDAALGRPEELALVDVGAGRGELLTGVLAAVDRELGARLRPYAVERAPRPDGLDARVAWLPDLPEAASWTGLVFANEWLDNVPVEVAETDEAGVARAVQVAPDGAERLGPPVAGADAEWLARWWPLGGGETGVRGTGAGARPETGPRAEPGLRTEPEPRTEAGLLRTEAGLRAEIGRPRDEAWARAVASLSRGLAVAVDYGHDRAARPSFGTLTGFRDGHEVRPVPDGSCDITAHVAMDACAAAGAEAVRSASAEAAGTGAAGTGAARSAGAASGGAASAGTASGGNAPGGAASEAEDPLLLTQRNALRSLGVTGGRPPLSLASTDPTAYVRALSSAGEAAELTDSAGLGAFVWLAQPVGVAPAALATLGLPAPA
ncbi:SAM-dependent methyltransferase [Streptomyces pathocidini]|uniref:SAM-dependent methyltransferase n=1 Tax=Streptomyces pathocidini TaxID=1650571 RepID=A0ABW7URX6_9ACTN